jgi:hypothetical protein
MQATFAASLLSAQGDKLSVAEALTASSTLEQNVHTLINALPYYGEQDFQEVHRGALAKLLAVNMVNFQIFPQPYCSSNGFGYRNTSSYSYSGTMSGHQQAFFANVSEDSVASGIAALVSTVESTCGDSWWGNYAVAVLTDAINGQVQGLGLNSSALSSGSQGLEAFNNKFVTVLTPTMAAVATEGFSPTSTALQTLQSAEQCQAALTWVRQRINSSDFIATIQTAISTPGQTEQAAEWFLLWLWITQFILGATPASVSSFINDLPSSISVPQEVNHENWWNPSTGGTGPGALWMRLSGTDLAPLAMDGIDATMPQILTQYTYSSNSPSGAPQTQSANLKNGYSWSYTHWGPSAKYL